MKITDLKVLATSASGRVNWTFVKVETDEGLAGYGEASNYPGSDLVIEGCKLMRKFLIGENPAYNAVLDRPLDIRDGRLHFSDRPGLGWGLNEDYIKEHPPVLEFREGFNV